MLAWKFRVSALKKLVSFWKYIDASYSLFMQILLWLLIELSAYYFRESSTLIVILFKYFKCIIKFNRMVGWVENLIH